MKEPNYNMNAGKSLTLAVFSLCFWAGSCAVPLQASPLPAAPPASGAAGLFDAPAVNHSSSGMLLSQANVKSTSRKAGKTMEKQTAGRDRLGDLAPKFAELNDDVLFGEVWSREKELSPRDRSLITIAALFSAGLYPQLKAHLEIGKKHGISKSEAVELVTQLAFYCGWPKAWSAFPLIREVYGDEGNGSVSAPSYLSAFPIGEKNDAYAQYFIGQSYLAPLSLEQVPVYNVTFEPGCRNNWHIHHAKSGGGQMLICVSGRGWYQEWGKEAQELHPGDVVNIPAGVKHWHGAAKDSWFQHLALEVPGTESKNEWCEPVEDAVYRKLP